MTRLLDVRGLTCPLPILKAKKALREMAPGELVEVLATDPGAVEDFRIFCETTGHELVERTEGAREFRFLIRRAGRS